MAGERNRIARWTERAPQAARELYQVVYREYIGGQIYQYMGKAEDRAKARSAVADSFHAVWGYYPSGYVEPTAE
jgi:hypothetical protein